jgi:hypothetical protein
MVFGKTDAVAIPCAALRDARPSSLTAAHSAARLRNAASTFSEISRGCTHTLHKPSGCGPRGATKLVFDALWGEYSSSGGRDG